jgi:hypothetical protein
MGFWQRLLEVESTQDIEAQSLLPELLASYREEARLARQIREHANLAPHQAGVQGLRAVAEEQERLVKLLHDKLAALGGEGSDNTDPLKGGKNHWTRVVQDVEENRARERYYNEQATRYDPALPDAAALFRTLEQGKRRINVLLRDIVSRADPHALD